MNLQPQLFHNEQHGTTSDDYYTPPEIFEALGLEFDLDVCSPPGGIHWIPTRNYYTQVDDGLLSEWYGRVWLNPPYSSPQQWIEKFIAHGDGVALVQVSKARWFNRLWASSVPMVLNRADFKFIATDGTYKGVFMPTCFIALGDECVEALARLGRVR